MDKFQNALKEGSLNITIASVLFVGTQPLLVANAEQIIFQEPVTTTSRLAQSVDHKVYFRAKGNPTLQKVKPFDYDDILKSSINFKQQNLAALISPKSTSQEQEKEKDPDVYSQDTESQHQVFEEDHILPATSALPNDNNGITSTDHEVHQEPDNEELSNVLSPSNQGAQWQPLQFELLDEIAKFQYIMQQDTTCGIELYHVFNYNLDFDMSEILKIFVRNISLCVVVTDASTEFSDKEISLIREHGQYASRGLICSCSDDSLHSASAGIRYTELNNFSEFLVTHSNASQPRNYIFSMNCKNPSSSDKETGANIVAHTLSSTRYTTYPSLWYYFGIKLQEHMASNNLDTLSVSKQCMLIAKQLKMDQPTIIAALENLCDNNMLLYFPDILNDEVFSGVHMFSRIFSELFKSFSSEGRQRGIVNQSQLMKAIKGFTSDHLSSQDFIKLFTELMILAPCDEHGEEYIIPCQLQLLTESERKNICSTAVSSNTEVLFFKCPSYGYEYVCMLIVFVLTLPSSKKWEILRSESSGPPVCLYKNSTKLTLKGKYIMTVSFIKGYIEIYVQSLDELHQEFSVICETILRGLEKIKLTLHQHETFEFGISFQCNCGKSTRSHVATYNKQSGLLICENNKSVTSHLSSSHKKLLPKPSGK